MTVKKTILICVMLYNSMILANATGNLIQNCQGNWHCELKELSLAPRQNFETRFELNYSYKCLGHTLDLGIAVENGDGFETKKIPFVLNSNYKTLNFEGLGPVKTKDFAPKRTSKAFLNNCYLEIHDFKVLGLSLSVKQSLKSQKETKENELKEIDLAADAFRKAITYQRLYQVMQQTCERVYTELSSESLSELITNLKSISPQITSLLADKASVLSPAEISALAKFLSLSNSASINSAFWDLEDGRARKIEELISEEDRLALQAITDKFAEDKSFIEDKLKVLDSQKRLLEAEIKRLENYING